ncbi:MAG TPA: L,D-transpeptidase [Pyrinomonadaceae bacterium]|jgi:murein L,D-transpeptidase YafK|nr:L,D-transpeptidase [Pyrinomonadaceae bacterium]
MRRKYSRLAAFVILSVALLACVTFAWGLRGQVEPADVPAPAGVPAAQDGMTPPPPRAAPLSPDERATNARPLKLPLADPSVVVMKGARRLRLFDGAEVVRVFPVALGFAPEGDKARARDGRTPEGEFRVCLKNERSHYFLSLGLSYPNEEDADRGLRDGLITRAQHRRIVSADRAGRCPPWNTALGGEIFIHGGGVWADWTWGCVALDNQAVSELFDAVPPGTPVVIKP